MTDTLCTNGLFAPVMYSNAYMYDDIDMAGTYSTAPLMGGSIFTGGYPMGMPMVGMGYNNQAYFDNMRDYQRFQIDYNVDQQRMSRNADLRINAAMEGVKGAATALKDKIMKNEQDQIDEAYDKYVKAVAAAYGDGTPEEINARAKSLYTQMNGGVTLTQDLREYGHGSFTQGLLHSLSFGTYYRRSAEDNVAYTTGSPVATGEKAKQNLGRIVGAGVAGGAAGGIAVALGCAAAGPIGIAVGLGALALSFITGKVTT